MRSDGFAISICQLGLLFLRSCQLHIDLQKSAVGTIFCNLFNTNDKKRSVSYFFLLFYPHFSLCYYSCYPENRSTEKVRSSDSLDRSPPQLPHVPTRNFNRAVIRLKKEQKNLCLFYFSTFLSSIPLTIFPFILYNPQFMRAIRLYPANHPKR